MTSRADAVSPAPRRLVTPSRQIMAERQRECVYGHRAGVLWLVGLSGSGKSTLAKGVESKLVERGWHTCVLDGDNVRHGLSADLGFSAADRSENVRRTAEVARLLAESGQLVITALISAL